MRRLSVAALAASFVMLFGLGSVYAQGPVKRYAIIVASNDGGQGRAKLKYAGSDAQALAQVLVSLGGVEREAMTVMLEATPAQVRARLKTLSETLKQAQSKGQRAEVIIYYSGHADEQGMLLSGQRLPYQEIQGALAELPSPMKLLIVDSCHAGVLTRAKGGNSGPGFLHHYPGKIEGSAILAAGSASELAQESDAIKASYFTYYLVTGLRGAADSDQDGLVTLNEAYRFAFDETLLRTQTSKLGPQHPQYAMELKGHGDLVLTQLSKQRAQLVLGDSVEGKVVVQTTAGALRAEVHKPGKGTLRLAMPKDQYQIFIVRQGKAYRAQVALKDAPTTLTLSDFEQVPLSQATARGGEHGEAATIPFGLDLLPYVGTSSAGFWRLSPRNASLNLIGGLSGGTRGLEIGGAFNLNQGAMRGMQIGGALNYVDGDVLGLQLGGAANIVSQASKGIQIGGALNVVSQDVKGLQLGGAANIVGGDVLGIQVGGAANIVAGDVLGAQIGAFNLAGPKLGGLQIGAINLGQEVKGLQIGAINITSGQVKGLQIGAINISERSSTSIGAINIFTDGWTQLEAWTQDGSQVLAGVRHGGDVFYSTYNIGVVPFGDAGLTYGIGLGWRLLQLERLELAGELGMQQIVPEWTQWGSMLNQYRARVVLGLELVSGIEVFGGLGAAVGMGFDRQTTTGAPPAGFWPVWSLHDYDPIVELWPTVSVGVRLGL